MEVYPSLAFDSLFENRGTQQNKSILDRVMEDATRVRRRASVSDQAKLEEYLTSIREVEKRIERQRNSRGIGSRGGRSGWQIIV